MNIEESKKILDKFVTEHKLFNIKHSDGLEEAIETLLTAYEKEKEKNKSLEQESRIRPATRLCDYEGGLLFDAPDENGIKRAVQKSQCSTPLCDKCTHKLNKKDYCTRHWKEIKKEVERS